MFALMSCSQGTEKGIEVNNAWIREAPPGATVAALYFDINNSGADDYIVSIKSPVSEKAEIHNTEVSPDGTGMMVRLDKVSVGSGETLSFTPGGKHIMLIDLIPVLRPGDVHEVTIDFENSGQKTVKAVVKGFGENGGDDHSGHSMDH